jgi:hypothetical protein
MHIVSEPALESTSRTKSLLSVLTEAAKNLGIKEAHERLLSILMIDCQEETTNSGSNSENQHNNSLACQRIIANAPNALAANPPIFG